MRIPFETTTVRTADIFANGKEYEVPPFQRQYAWTEEEWEILWEDLMYLQTGQDDLHYMGPLLFQSNQDTPDHFVIIDGQQRLATIVLLVLAAIHRFEQWARESDEEAIVQANRERAEIFRRRFIGEKEPMALLYRPRLTLNRTDKRFFRELISDRYRERRVRSPSPESHRQLYGAYRFFVRKLQDEKEGFHTPEDLARFIDQTVSQKLLFTRILVADDANAYLIFETLNARGVELAPSDLIKNYLFALLDREGVPQQDIVDLMSVWDEVIESLGVRAFIPFLRAYVNATSPTIIRTERLFHYIKSEITNRERAQTFIEDVRDKADVFLALHSPESDFWNIWPDHQDIRHLLSLLKLFSVRQHIPLLFAVYDATQRNLLRDRFFRQLLRDVVVITFRYSIIGKRNPNQLERLYASTAYAIHAHAIDSEGDVRRALRAAYLPDNEFEQSFTNIAIPTRRYKRLVKYILLMLEEWVQHPDHTRFYSPEVIHAINDSTITIEHILPRQPLPDWQEAFPDHATWLYRLGNLTLLEDTLNREAANKSFSEKRALYRRSRFSLTRALADLEEWTPEALRQRQSALAQYATHIWRIDV